MLQAIEAGGNSSRLDDTELPGQDSNLDKESQKVIPPQHKLHAEKSFGHDAIPFDAGLREIQNPTTLDADLRRLLDAWRGLGDGDMSIMAERGRRLAELRALLDAERAKAKLPPRKSGDPEPVWPVFQAIERQEQGLVEAAKWSDTMQRNATLPDALTPAQENALAALLAGKSVTEAAGAAGVNRTTVHRWLKDDFGFIAALNRGRRDLRTALQMRLMALAERAAECVERTIGDGKTALALLKGLGLLSGAPEAIGSEDPVKLADDAALQSLL